MPSAQTGDHACRECSARFLNPQHLAARRWRKHGLVSDERQFCFDAVCRACQTCFWSIRRLQQHLKASRRFEDGCYCQLTWWCKPLRVLQHVDRPEALKCFHRLPACPTMMSDRQPDRINSADEALQKFQDEWLRLELPEFLLPDDQNLVFSVINGFMQTITQYYRDEGQSILSSLLDRLIQPDVQVSHEDTPAWALCVWIKDHFCPSAAPLLDALAFDLLREDLWSLVYDLPVGQMLAWKWRMDEAHIPVQERVSCQGDRIPAELNVPSYVDQDSMILQMIGMTSPQMPSCQGVPVTMWKGKPCLLIFHLYSGRRRTGDCHDWVAHLVPRLIPDYEVMVVSVDTAIDPIHGNLDKGPGLTHALTIAEGGHVAGVLTGPPCETWSNACALPPPPEVKGHWPRPIRTSKFPWGRPTNIAKEIRQTSMGSRLLLHSWQVETATVLRGGGSIMEHPSEPRDVEAAATWKTRTHEQILMNLPLACCREVQQWKYGCSATKPTCLRSLNLPVDACAKTLRDTELAFPSKPILRLEGKTASGEFRTSAGKEYPMHFCKALCATLLTGLRDRISTEGIRLCTVPLTPEQVMWIGALSEASGQFHMSTFLPD